MGAEVGAPIPYHCPLNGGAADGAGLTTPMGNLKLEVGCPQFTAGAVVVHNTSSLITNSCPKHLLDGMVKTFQFIPGQAPS